jgi:DNA-binding CsgD family transcriptional regulator
LPAAQDVVGLRERLVREGEEEKELSAAYHEGRSLPVGEVAALALSLLGEFAQVLPHPEMAQGSAETPERPPQPSQLPDQSSRSPLTAREQEVLRLVAEGRSSKTIGRQLFIAPSTVNYHLTSIFNKLAVDSRAQAVAVAAQRGLL